MFFQILFNFFTLGEMIQFDMRIIFWVEKLNKKPSSINRIFSERKANSHSQCGWQRFTDHVISTLNDQREGSVRVIGEVQKRRAIWMLYTCNSVVVSDIIFFNLYSDTWQDDPIWRAHFSDGVKPPTIDKSAQDVYLHIHLHVFMYICTPGP